MTNAAVFAREVRVLEGPNLYFTRPAVKVVLAVPGLVGMPDADFAALWDRAGARGGGGRALAPAGSAGRQRMVLRLIESMTRRLVRAVGVTRVGLRVRAGSGVDEVVVAFVWRHRHRAVAFGEALAPLLDVLADQVGRLRLPPDDDNPYVWRVLPAGGVWLGREDWQEYAGSVVSLAAFPQEARELVSCERGDLLPGLTYQGRQISRVQVEVCPDSVRQTLWYEG